MARVGFILLIFLRFSVVQAQTTFQVSGKITDSTGVTLQRATVSIITAQDTLTSVTKEDGIFIFNSLAARKFRVLVTMKGYSPLSKSYIVPVEQRSFQIGNLTLKPDFSELDPVTITHLRPITYLDDTVSYHVTAFPVRDGAEVEDILKRLPGLEVDMSGNVFAQGKKVQKVTVNGKDFFGGDVLLAIRNLPAEIVDKLQVIDDYGNKARLTGIKSGESIKVLNIVTKADKRNGQFGNMQSSAGDYGKYSGEIFGNAFKGDQQISVTAGVNNTSPIGNNPANHEGVNYANQWNQWGGSINYNANGQHSNAFFNSIQDSYFSGGNFHAVTSNQAKNTNEDNNVGVKVNYKPNGHSSLEFNTFVTQRSSNSSAYNSFTTLLQDSNLTKSTTGFSSIKTKSTGRSLNSNLTYEKLSSQSRRRFSVQASLDYSNTRQIADNASNATVTIASILSNSTLHYLVDNTSPTANLSLHSTYFLPLGSNTFLELGYNGQVSVSHVNVITQTPDTNIGRLTMVDSLTQNQSYQTVTQTFHLAYTGHINKLDISAGLDGQPGVMQSSTAPKENTIRYHYFSLLPRIEGAWSFNKFKKINLTYSSQPNLPAIAQLSPFTNLINPQYPVIGNPNLRPSHTSAITLNYEQSSLKPTKFSGFNIGLGYTTTGQPIVSNISHPKDNSQVVQQTSYSNAGVSSAFYADYNVNFPPVFKHLFRITTSGSFSINQNPSITDGLIYTIQSSVWNQSAHFQLSIPDIIETSVEANYSMTHSIIPNSENLPHFFKTASLSLSTRQYLLRHWVLSYQLSQPYTSKGQSITPAPTDLSASIERQFLRHNKATIGVNAFNLLNNTTGVGQSSSFTNLTQTKTQYIGRYFFCFFVLKLNRFKS